MLFAIIIFVCMLAVQFAVSIDSQTEGLTVLTILEIICFIFIMRG